MNKINFIIPSTVPVGGIIKIFDFICHADELGYRCEFYYPTTPNFKSPLFDNKRYTTFKKKPYKLFTDLKYEKDAFYFFSWPYDFVAIQTILPSTVDFKKVIHIIQGIHHASNHGFCDGYALKILSYPFNRIILGEIAQKSIDKFLPPYGLNQMVNIGHDLDYFAPVNKPAPKNQGETIHISYTTWKSDIGQRIEKSLKHDKRFKFKHISKLASLGELKDLYHWSDIFLGTPRKQEGTYMPGLEALASGLVLVIPNVGGNMAYAANNEQVIIVDFEDTNSYIEALLSYANNPQKYIPKNNYLDRYKKFSLETEKMMFKDYLKILELRN